MGNCCYSQNEDNNDLIFEHNKGESAKGLNALQDRETKMKSLFRKNVKENRRYSNKDTNENEEKKEFQDSIHFSEFSYLKETSSQFYEDLTEKEKKIIVNEFIAPIESINGNSGFINKEDFELDVYISSNISKEEKTSLPRCRLLKKKSNSLKRFTKKNNLYMKDKDSGYVSSSSTRKTIKRVRIKLLSE